MNIARVPRVMIQRRVLVRHLLKKIPDEELIRNRCALMNTGIRCAEEEARESGALQLLREGGEAPP